MNKKRKSQPEDGKRSEVKIWKGVILGGIPGILLGAGGVIATEAFASDAIPQSEIPVAHTPNDDMSFSDAFVAAREEVGPGGAFVWHCNVYSTYRADDPEWIAMGPDGQAAHCGEILMQVHPETYSPNGNDISVVLEDNNGSGEVPPENDPDNSLNNTIEDPEPVEADVQITDIVSNPETGETAAVGQVDGLLTVFIDEDGDGVVDTILHDDNNDGQVGSDEIYSAEGSNITISELSQQMDRGEDVNLYPDQPDYTNEGSSDYVNQANVEGF